MVVILLNLLLSKSFSPIFLKNRTLIVPSSEQLNYLCTSVMEEHIGILIIISSIIRVKEIESAS